MRTERVIAVDPGKLTGICCIERRGDVVTLLASEETPPELTIPRLREWFSIWGSPEAAGDPRARVVMESFLIGQKAAEASQEASWALRTQGAVEQLCRDEGYPVEAIVFYAPSRKAVFPNPRLRRVGIWHRGGKGHALDSIRHGLLYLMQTGTLAEKT